MTDTHSINPIPQRQLLLWPGVVIVALQWLFWFILPVFIPDAVFLGIVAAPVGGLAVIIWWAFFSRAPVIDRWGTVGLVRVALALTYPFLHESIATTMMGMSFKFGADLIVRQASIPSM